MAFSILILAVYLLLLLLLTLFGVHRSWLLLRLRRAQRVPQHLPHAWPSPQQAAHTSLPDYPLVTVQLPIYNERLVVERCIRAAARLDWPRDRLEIQVLDDSTDDTWQLAERVVQEVQREGIQIRHIRRTHRQGFKAGALAEGLAQARGTLIALFDADFVPEPDFLLRLVPEFETPSVGLVQARWSHLNADASMLTQVQALMLDAHFRIEHASRHRAGHFFNFNGTAGIWRRTCIASAGGWQGDTLTEDLDLSYRAQLLGWTFVYRDDVMAPAELPERFSALRTQQRRWAMGGLQVARKLLPTVLSAPLSLGIKRDALFHLLSGAVHLLLVGLALLLPGVAHSRHVLTTLGIDAPWRALEGLLFAFSLGSLYLFYAAVMPHELSTWKRLRNTLWVLAIGSGLALSLATGGAEALFGRARPFERTPKRGDAARPLAYRSTTGLWPLWEGLLGLWILLGPATLWLEQKDPTILPLGPGVWFTCLFVCGCFYSSGLGLLEASEARTRPTLERKGPAAPRSVPVQEVKLWTHP